MTNQKIDLQTIKGRLNYFLKSKNILKKNFCKDVCVSSAYVSSIKKSISDEVKSRIAEVYPELNMDWLVTGRQPMIRPEYNKGGEYEVYTRFTEAVSGHFRDDTDMDGKTESPEEWRALVKERDMEIVRLRAQIDLLKELLAKKS